MHACARVRAHSHTHTHTHTHTYTSLCVYVHVYMCVCTFPRTHAHAHARTHTHTHTHTHIINVYTHEQQLSVSHHLKCIINTCHLQRILIVSKSNILQQQQYIPMVKVTAVTTTTYLRRSGKDVVNQPLVARPQCSNAATTACPVNMLYEHMY